MVYEEIELENEWWSPSEKGQYIEGIIVDVVDDEEYGKQYYIDRKIQGKGLIKTPGHVVLQMLMNKLGIKERVRITYKGEKEAKPPKKPVQLYKVEVWKQIENKDEEHF